MNQVIDGKSMYVVDFDTMPEMPITGRTEDEELFYRFMRNMYPGPVSRYNHAIQNQIKQAERGRYSEALQDAIKNGLITEPGKYGIHLVYGSDRYEIAKIIEP